MKKVIKLLPGAALALAIAAAARLLEYAENAAGLHMIGASVIALFIGMIVNRFCKPSPVTAPGIKFTSKKILKFAIILLGASLNISTVLKVGRFSLTVMVFTLATCFGLGYVIGRALGLNWKTSSLINAGTGICGGSAIAAIAPVIEASDLDVAYGMSATFLFDMIMIIVFPLLGRWMGLSDAAFGLWAGTAVNDTSSVVATGYAFSEAAGDFATMVKLTRTLTIIPTVLVFAAISMRLKKKEAAASGKAYIGNDGFEVDLEQIIAWDPDIIFLDPGNMDLVNDEYANNPGFFDSLRAVQEGQVYTMPSTNAAGPNVTYLLINAYYAGLTLYPEQFSDVRLEDKAAEIMEMMLGENFFDQMVEGGLYYGTITIGE